MFRTYEWSCLNAYKVQKKKSSQVTFGDNGHGNILGIGKIGKNPTNYIENVYLVDEF